MQSVCVCVCFFYRTEQVECSSLFFPFLPLLFGDQKSLHFGCNLKIALHICFWICPPKMQATFFPFWMRSFKQRLVPETGCCFLEHTNYRGSTSICNNNTQVNKVVKKTKTRCDCGVLHMLYLDILSSGYTNYLCNVSPVTYSAKTNICLSSTGANCVKNLRINEQ